MNEVTLPSFATYQGYGISVPVFWIWIWIWISIRIQSGQWIRIQIKEGKNDPQK
jgi:hypothetical protein